MTAHQPPKPGTVCWRDLTVDNAEEIRDFYKGIVGWEHRGEDMGGYEDFHMLRPGTDESTAGICHARGSNADLPPQWLIYITVEDVKHSAARCEELGGQVLVAPRSMGGAMYSVIRDPAGAVCALYQPTG
jgi:predicted enzyme related to lactoylglutathione lyase